MINYSEIFLLRCHTVTCNFIKLLHHPSSGNTRINTFSLGETSSWEKYQETTGMFSVIFNKNPPGKWIHHLSLFSTRSGWTLEQVAHGGCRSTITWRCSKFSWTRPWATWVILEVGPALSRPLHQMTSLRVPSNLNYCVIQIEQIL